MRSILRIAFVVVPTAVLSTAVVIGVSRSGERAAVTADGDLMRDLKLASATSLELAPTGQALATVSSIEAPPAAAPERTVRPRRSSSGPRVARSRAPVVRAAPEPDVAEEVDASPIAEATELASSEAAEAPVEAPTAGGVALPRPTAIPVIFPTGGDAGGGGGTYDPGPGTVIRGGGVDGDHCQIHRGRGGRIYGPPIFRQPRATTRTVRDRILSGGTASETRRPTIRDRVRVGSTGGRSSNSSGGTIRDRIRRGR
ncbi:MAG: hypothetical protein ABR499_03515 [Gemmatimonadaceae bacterium]